MAAAGWKLEPSIARLPSVLLQLQLIKFRLRENDLGVKPGQYGPSRYLGRGVIQFVEQRRDSFPLFLHQLDVRFEDVSDFICIAHTLLPR